MKFREQPFVPMIFGGDINTYSVARAFYEEYGVKCHTFGKYPTGPSKDSFIIDYTADERIDRDEYFLFTVRNFCRKHQDKKVILVGCGDSYVALIAKHKKEFPENAIAAYIDFELMDSLQQKERFYALCDEYGIDHPATHVFKCGDSYDVKLPWEFPVVLKPSDCIGYWEHPFEGQEKVYIIQSQEELQSVLKQIYDAGYDDDMIIQDMIPGNDEYMRVLTCYSDHNAQVKMMCLGHVLLEEHTPLGKGNHALIITEYEEELMMQAKKLLEALHYVGFSNFDIKYDSRDGKFKFFEINTRQGRSNYYVTGSGFNIAKYLVEEYVYGRELPFEAAKEEHLWTVVPKGVARTYVREPQNREKVERLYKEGKVVNPIFMKGDNHPRRYAHMMKNYLEHYGKFKKYYNL